ncbi:hypothetical protein GCM10017786_66860 [Amycolatopsis deserti]|uniref:Uncharacterized protein n=1 Tax=Amycolatopsis deserti TaxID=185696 RepID=A0ABQ3JE60_9PSEU|nr:hypothetical protein GCM10017786_66860 [Amycolatopsis deserti]
MQARHLGEVVAEWSSRRLRFVHITLSQGRKVGMVGRRLAAWVAALAQGDRHVSGDGMTTQLTCVLWASARVSARWG